MEKFFAELVPAIIDVLLEALDLIEIADFQHTDDARGVPAPAERPRPMMYVIFLCLGGLAGLVTLLVTRHALIHGFLARIAILVLAPILVGLGFAVIFGNSADRSREYPLPVGRRSAPALSAATHFWRAFCFCFGLLLVRLICAPAA